MPIYKTEILGSKIEINYELNELNKLINLIEIFTKRINEFPNNGRISNNVIIFLAALKTEDDLEELKKKFKESSEEKKHNENIINEKKIIVKELSNKIMLLKDEIVKMKNINDIELRNNTKSIQEIIKLEEISESIKKKIKNSIKNE